MKNGIVVPTHPKDFHWTEQLLRSAKEEEIILVFSSEEDKKAFSFDCKSIVVGNKPDNIESVATFKKLKALEILHKDYDYLATIDTECMFLKTTTPYLKDIWNNNCIVANCSISGADIIKQCLIDTNVKDYPYSNNLYFWFNDIQVYPTSLVSEFLEWCPKNIKLASFDYLLFGIFMITKHNHNLKLIKGVENFGIIENLTKYPDIYPLVKETNWSPYFPGVEKYDNVKILFHLDRYPLGDIKL
jgi:hypothetical protein